MPISKRIHKDGSVVHQASDRTLPPLEKEGLHEPAICDTYPQLQIQKAATGPGSILNRQGGSIFNRREQPFLYRLDRNRAKIWNEDYKEGGHYYDPLYGDKVIHFGGKASIDESW